MKKRTVITTEKREVWVIRQPGEEFAEEDSEYQESEAVGESQAALPDYHPDSEEPESAKNH
jgi:hypothetical protein